METKSDYFFKFCHKIITPNGQKIELSILEHNEVTIEIKLKNLSYNDQMRSKFKSIWMLSVVTFLYIILLLRNIYVDTFLAIFIFILIYQLFYIVKEDSVSFYGGFALQISTIYFLNFKNSLFIPADYVYDIIINEVISEFSIKYILLARLQDESVEKNEYEIKPIIQLLRALPPGIDCLEIIYKHLRRKVEKSQE